jgi:superfamily II DNA/RNA helicase
MTTFAALNLCAPLLSAIDAQGFTAPTDIQTDAIPSLMAGNDLMGAAQTGGGKTAAFLLPILNKLIEENERPVPGSPKVLILAPTRELAQQIGDTVALLNRAPNFFIPSSMVARRTTNNCLICAVVSISSSPRRVVCMTTLIVAPCAWTRSQLLFWTNVIACWTWVLLTKCAK